MISLDGLHTGFPLQDGFSRCVCGGYFDRGIAFGKISRSAIVSVTPLEAPLHGALVLFKNRIMIIITGTSNRDKKACPCVDCKMEDECKYIATTGSHHITNHKQQTEWLKKA